MPIGERHTEFATLRPSAVAVVLFNKAVCLPQADWNDLRDSHLQRKTPTGKVRKMVSSALNWKYQAPSFPQTQNSGNISPDFRVDISIYLLYSTGFVSRMTAAKEISSTMPAASTGSHLFEVRKSA